jgi:hypothetical protein
MVSAGVVVFHECADLAFKVARQEVMLEEHAVIRFADLRFMVWCQRSIFP